MKTFDNVASLKLARLNANQFVETGGFTEKGGTGAKRYFTKTAAQAAADGDVVDDVHTNFVLANGIVAIDTSKPAIEHYTLAEAKALAGAFVGQVIQISDRGSAQFEAVSSAGNTANELDLIQGQNSITWKLIQKDSISIDSLGGIPNATLAGEFTKNNEVLRRCVAMTKEERAAGSTIVKVFDLEGKKYRKTGAITINTSSITFKNGVISQVTNTTDNMQSDGSEASISYVTLENIVLDIEGTANQFSGVNFRHLTGTLAWFKWDGLNSIMKQGLYGFANGYGTASGVDGNTGGPIWELRLSRLWFNGGWSSGLFIPSNGGEFSLSSFDGGSTTYKINNVHTTNIQAGAPAYRLGNGIDHAILENVTADSCTKFAEFKVKTLIVNNCGMEKIKPPTDPAAAGNFYGADDYDLILVGQQQSFDLTGFTTSFGSELMTTPHDNMSHLRLNSVSSRVAGVIGGTVGDGRVLTVNGGRCTKQSVNVPGASDDSVINGATLNDINNQRFGSTVAQTGTFDLWTIQPDGLSRAYLVTMLHTFNGNSSINTLVVHTSGEAGFIQGDSANILDGIYASPAVIAVVGDKVQATVSGATFVTWSAIELTAL